MNYNNNDLIHSILSYTLKLSTDLSSCFGGPADLTPSSRGRSAH